jgi:hypothetical protein
MVNKEYSRKLYLLSKRIIELLQQNNGYIFGGAVRDTILHDHISNKFYKEFNKIIEKKKNKKLGLNLELVSYSETESDNDSLSENENISSCSLDIDSDIILDVEYSYQNSDLLPELSDRFLYPEDIDCLMSNDSKKIFLKNLNNNGLRHSRIFLKPLKIYIENTNNSLTIERVKIFIDISPIIKNILKISFIPYVYVDIISKDNTDGIYPPFGGIDFECNSLILTPNNDLVLSSHLSFYNDKCPKIRLLKIHSIIKDIENKIAKTVTRVPLYRTKKMQFKKWKICAEFINIDGIINYTLDVFENLNIKESCPICLEDFIENDYYLRRSCCKNALFHQKCFSKIISSNVKKNCPFCNSELAESEIINNRKVCLC